MSIKDRASIGLRIDWSVPRITDERRDAIATPAASSDAELIRFPVDNLCIEASIFLLLKYAGSAANAALLLVPIDKTNLSDSIILDSRKTSPAWLSELSSNM